MIWSWTGGLVRDTRSYDLMERNHYAKMGNGSGRTWFALGLDTSKSRGLYVQRRSTEYIVTGVTRFSEAELISSPHCRIVYGIKGLLICTLVTCL
jgi:hypothetical protein